MGESLGRSKILQRKMQEKQNKIALIYFRNNLRVEDNESLQNALLKYDKIIGIYCFEPIWFEENEYGFSKMGYYRLKFILESLENLKENLKKLNIPLLVSKKCCLHEIPLLVEKHNVNEVFAQNEWTFEENEMFEKLKGLIPNTNFNFSFDQLLIQPKDLPFKINNTSLIFTEFRKQVEKNLIVNKSFKINEKADLNFYNTISEYETLTLNSFEFEAHGISPKTAFPFEGGEDAALERLNYYLFESKLISKYKETRNGLIGADYSSKLSPWLANGCISARKIYAEVKKYEQNIEKNESTYWLIFELLWREFFKFTSMKYGNEIFYLHGFNKKNKAQTAVNKKVFEMWALGKTKVDFVDANMNELYETGFMSNRGRQIVASYWCNDLKQDWRIAASYFEYKLIDYDVHSNWCNWAYIAGVGNDPRPDRYFNIEKQAQNYDPQKNYRNLWLKP